MGQHRREPGGGEVYVIGFNVPTILRLLKTGEMRSGRGDAPPEKVTDGRWVTEGFGLYPTIVNPPYTTLNAYDLNAGTLKWQIGLGDDPRLVSQGITGTGAAMTVKGGIIATGTGLLFVTAADRKVHVYDSATGKQVSELPLGAATSGAPSMYEHDGRQYPLRHGVRARRRSTVGRADRDHRLRPAEELRGSSRLSAIRFEKLPTRTAYSPCLLRQSIRKHRRIEAAERSMSSSVVFQFDTEMRIAGSPFHRVPPAQQTPSAWTYSITAGDTLVPSGSPKRASTWFSTTSLRMVTPASRSRIEAMCEAARQQRSIRASIPERPNVRSAA